MPLVTSSAPRPGTNQPRVPKLSYRNSAVIETSTADSRQSTSTVGTTTTAETHATGLTSPPLSEASFNGPRSPASLSPYTPPSPSLAGPNAKKRGSFLGFFSVRDPSIAAMQQYEEQMKREGTYKKDTQHRPLLKSTEKWDGRPETLVKQQREAEMRAKQQRSKEREEAVKEMQKRGIDLDKRRSLGNFGLATSQSMESMSVYADSGNPFGFDVNSTSTLDSGSSKSLNRPPFVQADSYSLSDSSGLRRSQSDTGSKSGGNSHQPMTSLAREGSMKSYSSSISSDVAPFLDKDMPAPPEIPAEYRNEKISKPLPPIPSITSCHPVLPIVVEPPNGPSTKSFADQMTGQLSPIIDSTPAPKTAAESLEKLPPSYAVNRPFTSTFLGKEEVVVRSSGPNILRPPTNIKPKIQVAPFLAGEAQELELTESPSSIVKTNYATPYRKSAPSWRKIAEHDGSLEREVIKPLDISRPKVAIATATQLEALPAKGIGDAEGNGHVPARDNTPALAPTGRALFKSGRLGLFLKERGGK